MTVRDSVRFSLVYPTRHRPQFVEMALTFLEQQEYENFEVIVSDNFVNAALSCEPVCRKPRAFPVRYVRPAAPLSMVANWNYALQFATGEYVCYFTDKMFLLPGTLAYVSRALQEFPADIVNWVDNKFQPNEYPDYFGPGVYVLSKPGVKEGALFEQFDPLAELRKKTEAAIPRAWQDASTYARGKFCFGAYSRRLIERVIGQAGAMFHDIAPDYTSMVLGLTRAESAIEIARPGIVHILTDLSNGGLTGVRDDVALRFLSELESYPTLLSEMLVPGLYCSQANVLAHDYLSMQRRFGLPLELNERNWLSHIGADLDMEGRCWSSPGIESEQRALYATAISKRVGFSAVTPVRQVEVEDRVAELSLWKKLLVPFVPRALLRVRRQLFPAAHGSTRELSVSKLIDVAGYREPQLVSLPTIGQSLV